MTGFHVERPKPPRCEACHVPMLAWMTVQAMVGVLARYYKCPRCGAIRPLA